jgi:hypothetical protein
MMQSPVVLAEGPGTLPTIKVNGSMPVSAHAYSVSPYVVHAVSGKPVVLIEIPRHARLLSAYGETTDLNGAWFCMENSSCQCPNVPGQVPPTKPLHDGAYLAMSGDPHGFNKGQITYYSLDELCHQGPHPPRVKPGFWKAAGHITGGFQTTNGQTVRLVSGGGFSFCMHVLNGGGIDSQGSSWQVQPSRIDVESQSGSGHGDFSGSGDITGYLGKLEVTGQMHVDITVEIEGFTYSQPFDFQGEGPLDIGKVSATRFSGDFAIANRQAQQSLGWASNEKGSYVARLVGSCLGPARAVRLTHVRGGRRAVRPHLLYSPEREQLELRRRRLARRPPHSSPEHPLGPRSTVLRAGADHGASCGVRTLRSGTVATAEPGRHRGGSGAPGSRWYRSRNDRGEVLVDRRVGSVVRVDDGGHLLECFLGDASSMGTSVAHDRSEMPAVTHGLGPAIANGS